MIHSFNVPELRIKQDAVPGIDIPVWWVPTVTTAEMRQQLGKPEFVYEIACAQLCGLGHYRMRGFVTIDEPAGVPDLDGRAGRRRPSDRRRRHLELSSAS